MLGCAKCGSFEMGEHKADCPLTTQFKAPTGYPPRPENIPDNAIAKAALAVRSLHEQNIELMDGGHFFTKNGKSVNRTMRANSLAEIALCDEAIAASTRIHKDVTMRGASLHFKDAETVVEAIREQMVTISEELKQ